MPDDFIVLHRTDNKETRVDLTLLDREVASDLDKTNLLALLHDIKGEDQLKLMKALVTENRKQEKTGNWMNAAGPGKGHESLYLEEVKSQLEPFSGDPRPYEFKHYSLRDNGKHNPGDTLPILQLVETDRNPKKPNFFDPTKVGGVLFDKLDYVLRFDGKSWSRVDFTAPNHHHHKRSG